MRIAIATAIAGMLATGCAGTGTPMGSADSSRDQGARRFALTKFSEMSPEQKAAADALRAGPRAAVGSSANAAPDSIGSPFNIWVRSPELLDRLQRVGEYIRFKSSLPPRLNEFAILITAREWNAQYEWFAHHRLAMAGGLDPRIAAELAEGKVPTGMKPDEQVVYDFTTELYRHKGVSDTTYKRAMDAFGERGVADLVAVNGYYVLVAMTVNVDRTPIPGDGKPPLQPLK
jgi:4-carboxymuconolactone decarboxylase